MTTRRLISTEIWEPRGFETYLEEMEASGLRLAKAGGWLLYFDRAQPRQMRYRVEYIRHPSEEQLALYADCGWEHVAQTNREVQIFRVSVDAGIPELHTERETERAMYRHISRAASGMPCGPCSSWRSLQPSWSNLAWPFICRAVPGACASSACSWRIVWAVGCTAFGLRDGICAGSSRICAVRRTAAAIGAACGHRSLLPPCFCAIWALCWSQV